MSKAARRLMHPFPIQHILHLDVVPVTDEIQPFLLLFVLRQQRNLTKGQNISSLLPANNSLSPLLIYTVYVFLLP